MAAGRKTALTINLTSEERDALEAWQRSTVIQAGLAKRGRIILLVANRNSVTDIARMVGIRRRQIYKWSERFLESRLAGLRDKDGRGRKPHVLA